MKTWAGLYVLHHSNLLRSRLHLGGGSRDVNSLCFLAACKLAARTKGMLRLSALPVQRSHCGNNTAGRCPCLLGRHRSRMDLSWTVQKAMPTHYGGHPIIWGRSRLDVGVGAAFTWHLYLLPGTSKKVNKYPEESSVHVSSTERCCPGWYVPSGFGLDPSVRTEFVRTLGQTGMAQCNIAETSRNGAGLRCCIRNDMLPEYHSELSAAAEFA